jgi:hypothetical protein
MQIKITLTVFVFGLLGVRDKGGERVNRKIMVLISVVIIASLLLGSSVTACPICWHPPRVNSFQALWNAIFGVQDDVANLQAQVADLQAQIDALESGTPMGLPAADYDSGWVQMTDVTNVEWATLEVEHNLGTYDLLVYVYFNRGSETYCNLLPLSTTDNLCDVYWQTQGMNALDVQVPQLVGMESTLLSGIYIRVLIWKIP